MPILKLKEGLTIFYEIMGPGLDEKQVKTLLFIHGGPGLVDGRLYHVFWGQFASKDLRVVFIDQRGSGRSDDPDSLDTLNIAQHAHDLFEVCQQLKIDNPIIAGVSQGGYVALSYASQYPQQVGGLIACNTEAKRNTEERCKAHQYSLVNYFNKGPEEAKNIVDKLRDCDVHWDAELYKEFLPYYAKNFYRPEEIAICQQHPETWKKFMTDEFPVFDLSKELNRIVCPVLYLVGEFDCVHPPACAKQAVRLMTQVKSIKFCEIKNTADPVYRDQPEAAAQAVKEFFAKIYGIKM